jgi:hypothetical protein
MKQGGGSWGCIAISPDGKKAATTTFGRRLEVWNVATGKMVEEQSLPEYDGSVRPFLEFSADGAFLYAIWGKQILEAKLGGKTVSLPTNLIIGRRNRVVGTRPRWRSIPGPSY